MSSTPCCSRRLRPHRGVPGDPQVLVPPEPAAARCSGCERQLGQRRVRVVAVEQEQAVEHGRPHERRVVDRARVAEHVAGDGRPLARAPSSIGAHAVHHGDGVGRAPEVVDPRPSGPLPVGAEGGGGGQDVVELGRRGRRPRCGGPAPTWRSSRRNGSADRSSACAARRRQAAEPEVDVGPHEPGVEWSMPLSGVDRDRSPSPSDRVSTVSAAAARSAASSWVAQSWSQAASSKQRVAGRRGRIDGLRAR